MKFTTQIQAPNASKEDLIILGDYLESMMGHLDIRFSRKDGLNILGLTEAQMEDVVHYTLVEPDFSIKQELKGVSVRVHSGASLSIPLER